MSNLKTLKDMDFNNKRVIIRVDFSVPIKDNKIMDDNRIVQSIKTIKYVLDNNAKSIILLSHLGKVKTEEDKHNNSLSIIIPRLEELLNTKVDFIKYPYGEGMLEELNKSTNTIKLVENTRFTDLSNLKESNCDDELASFWSSLADLFVFDGFGVSHRNHASTSGIAKHLDTCVGFLVEEEINKLDSILHDNTNPFMIIMGGAKVKDKIGVINNLINKCDKLIIGGAMAFTFLKAKGYNVGTSLIDEESIDYCSNLLENHSDKIILPVDVITDERECNINDIKDDETGYDIGNNTITLFKQTLSNAKRIIINGTMGKNEDIKYSKGTKELFSYLANLNIKILVGGGDTASAVKEYGLVDSFYHVSTGGGATLEYLAGNLGDIFKLASITSDKDAEF